MFAGNVIDVEPIAVSSERFSANGASGNDNGQPYHGPSYSTQNNAGAPRSHTGTNASGHASPSSRLGQSVGGICELGAGALLAIVGVPMLILPGPGLLAIGAGGALAYDGIRRIAGKK